MEIVSKIAETLIPIFLVVGLGVLSVWCKVFATEDSQKFSKYDYHFGFPILILYSLLHTDFTKIWDFPFLATNVANLIVTTLFVLFLTSLFNIPRKFKGMLIIAGIYGNVAYMGIPMNEFLFGKEGVGYASVIVGIVSIFSLSVGIFLLEYFAAAECSVKSILKNIVKNPIIIAVILGITVSALKITLPKFLDDFLSMVSKSAGPIALFAIGMFFAKKRPIVGKGQIFVLCLANLILLPLTTYMCGKLFGLAISATSFKVSLLQAAMPLAATNFVLAQKYEIDQEVIANSIVISTVAALFTIGGLLYLIESGVL